MAYRNKIYVAFDGDTDMFYYTMMKAWDANKNSNFEFNNAHDLTSARDTSTEESIKRSLRVRLNNSKMFILLVGEHTKNLYKFVRWEIETAIELELPIIVVNLNKKRQDDNLLPPILNNQLHITIPYKEKIIKYAMDNWPQYDVKYRSEGKIDAYHYKDSTYKNLDL